MPATLGAPRAPGALRRYLWLVLLVGALAGAAVALWLTLRKRGPQREIARLPSAVTELAFSPDSRLLAAATWHDGTVRLLDPITGALVRSLEARPDVHALTFSRDGRYLAAVDDATPLSVWEVLSGAPVALPALAKGMGTAVAFAPDASELALGYADGTVAFVDLTSGSVRRRARHDTMVRAIAYAPSGLVASGDDGGAVVLWEREPEVQRARFTPHLGPVRAIAFAPDGTALVVSGDGPMVRMFDSRDGHELRAFFGHSARIEALGFAQGGGTLASAGADGTVRLWDPATGAVRAVLTPGQAPLYALAYAPSGLLLSAGDGDGRVFGWRLDPGRP